MFVNDLNKCFKNIETVLSITAVVPYVNIVSSGLRVLLGKSQIIGGLASAAFHYSASLFVEDENRRKILEGRAIKSLDYATHGALNCIRAIFELIPIFSLILLTKDLLIGKRQYKPLNENNVIYYVQANNFDFPNGYQYN